MPTPTQLSLSLSLYYCHTGSIGKEMPLKEKTVAYIPLSIDSLVGQNLPKDMARKAEPDLFIFGKYVTTVQKKFYVDHCRIGELLQFQRIHA